MKNRCKADLRAHSTPPLGIDLRSAQYCDLCSLVGIAVVDLQGRPLGRLRDLLIDLDSGLVTGCALESGFVATRVRTHIDRQQNAIQISAPSWSAATRFRSTHANQIMAVSLIGKSILAPSDEAAAPRGVDAGFVSGVISPVDDGPVRATCVARGTGGVLGLAEGAALIPWPTLSFAGVYRPADGSLRTTQSLAKLEAMSTWSDRHAHSLRR